MDAQNLASVAEGDWLIPSSGAARDAGRHRHERRERLAGRSSPAATASTAAPFQSAINYPQWKDQIATPALQQYFADQIDLDDLQSQLTDGWAQVSGG